MTKDRFDNIIKDKMESMRMDSSNNAWEDFSKRLDSELGPEYEKTINDQLDAEVHTKMNNLKVSFKSSHWLLLKERLETQALYIQNLYSSKSFELVIFLLLLITFAQKLPVPVSLNFDKKIIALNTSIQKINLTQVKPIQSIKKKQINKNIVGTHYDIAINAQEVAQTQNTWIADESATTQNINLLVDNPLAQSTNSISTLNNSKQQNALIEIPYLASLNMELDIATRNDINPKPENLISVLPAETPEAEAWLSMQASFDNNLINTPIDHLYKTAPYSNLAAGFSGGVNYDLRAEGVEIGTGLHYSSIKYNPQEVNIITGGIVSNILESSLENISFTYITVPLNLKFHFINVGSWSGFAQFGLHVNAILTADYPFETSTRENEVKPDIRGDIKSLADITPNKRYPFGLLQRGSFTDNIFLQANIGLGLQKNFSDKMGLYAMLSYNNHFLNSVGPNEDNLDKTSLTLGARYRL